jgi:predicted nucleotidyltransferase
MVTAEQIDLCIKVAKRYGAKRLVLFGSAALNPDIARDIDLICEGVKGVDFLMMGAEMENETGIMVDTVPADEPSAFVEYNLPNGKLLYESI